MFKKAVEAKSQQRLSGADRKKLKRTIRERFPNASDADIDVLLPPKVEITVSKYPNRVLVYGLEGDCPMFYESDGRGSEILPTVYALWKVPNLLPAFMLKGGEVSRFVLGGADLMFPGIQIPAEGLPSFSAGEPWAVKVPGNPAPIAVGATTMSSTEAVKAGLRGKALRISHYYGDTLWESAENCYVPNAGFFEDVVFGDPALSSAAQASDSCEDDSSVAQRDATNTENMEDASAADGTPSIVDSASAEDPTVTNEVSEEITTTMADLQVVENSSSTDSHVDDQQSLSVNDVDALLDKCLLQALHTTVKDKDLPMPGSVLWSGHVLPCRPSGTTLDIKKSSFKKLSKWLQSRATSGLISVKEDKYKKEVTLFSVNRNHPDYTSFKPEKKKVEKNEQSAKSIANEGLSHKILEVVELYKPSSHVNPIFTAIGADMGKLYSASEASQIVFGYIEKEKLVKEGNKSIVVLDAALCDALFKGAIKKGSMYPTEIHKKDIAQTFINRMQAHHLVTRGGDSVVRKGALKPLQIMTERRQGNKKVTKLSGVETFLIDPETLASELQKKFACSTTTSELPGKKGLEVLVQGGVIDDLARHLIEQYGIQKRYIEVLDKTKK
ncbi:Filamentous baseplate protein Ligatin, contains PUA domain [Handroanthus impetiginosus]|uniref:Filamentous baseplate protein Ligatin, contains PUA domain n=1 Tax=Handroanthus impetiginosus TaxID=429701 RepID=A0A2G9H286_9LAMI|nr:Filamentous baseplate protein Ligatin, contains PUA domain [Handroanthus impetiginosus]